MEGTLGRDRSREVAKEQELGAWQRRWMEDTSGRWTAKLIGELSFWFNPRQGQVNYYLTQMSLNMNNIELSVTPTTTSHQEVIAGLISVIATKEPCIEVTPKDRLPNPPPPQGPSH